MDDSRFDELSRSLAGPSRRSFLAALGAGMGALFGDDAGDETLAKRKKRKRATTRRSASRDRLAAEGRKKKKKKRKQPVATVPLAPPPPAPPPPLPDDCAPTCAATKPCGPDGCGGSCGTCNSPETCQNGTCQCVPNCAGKWCGPDGCGGTCGSCDDRIACTIDTCDEATATCRHTPDDGRCPPHWACDAQLGCFCPTPRQACGNVCVDTRTDPNHCGNCATQCQDQGASTCGMTGECVSGVCQRYAAGTVCRSASCIGESTGRLGATCQNGACPPVVDEDCSPYRCRDGACPGHCTGPDEQCISTHFCRFVLFGPGTCIPKRENGESCDRDGECRFGFCVGGVCCESACVAPENAQPTCAGGTCAFTCQEGFGDCDGDMTNGCETDVTASDPENCGACGQTCTASCGPNQFPECLGDQCVCTGGL